MEKRIGKKKTEIYTILKYFERTNFLPKPDYSLSETIERFEKAVKGKIDTFQTANILLNSCNLLILN